MHQSRWVGWSRSHYLYKFIEQEGWLAARPHLKTGYGRRVYLGDRTLPRGLVLQERVMQTDKSTAREGANVDFEARPSRQTGA